MLTALVAISLLGAPASVWPHPEACHVVVETSGAFSARGELEVNVVNAPAEGGPTEPPPLSLDPEVIAAWNKDLGSAIEEALRDLHLASSSAKGDLARFKAKAWSIDAGPGDRYFELRVAASPENGLGGHAAGNAIVVKLSSLHRAPDIVGEGRAAAFASSAEGAHDALTASLVAAITQAFAELRTHLDDERVKPRAHLTLAFLLHNLSAEQRACVVSNLAPCAAELAEPLSMQPKPNEDEQQFDVEYRLRRHEAKETEDEFVTSFAGTLSFEIGPNGKNRCSTWKTPLATMEVHVAKDLASKRVVVRFTPKDAP